MANEVGTTYTRNTYLVPNTDPIYKVGDIVRYNHGQTALMKITDIVARPNVKDWSGREVNSARYYGEHCLGGSVGANHECVQAASPEDLLEWEACAREYKR